MAVLMTPPKMQFLDDDGNPLALGKVYTYEAGTTTPKATYTTAAGDVANANPVILDASGRANIWLVGSYDFKLTDANDVEIYTQPNVTAFTALPASSDSFFQSFSGDGSEVAFTLSEDLGTDEKAILVFVNDGLEDHVTNGTFATDTGWTKGSGWTITGGEAVASSASADLSQTSAVTLVEGQAYIITYTITRSAGSVTPSIGGTDGTSRSSAGTYVESIIAGSDQILKFTGSGFTGTVDDVTVTPANSEGFNIQNPSAFTISGTTLTFTSAPPTGTNNIFVFAPSLLVGAASSAAADAAASATAAAASEVAAAASETSAEEWAVGTFVRGISGGGSAKDWSNYTGGTVDDSELSAKAYAQSDLTGASGGSAKDWAQTAENSVVASGEYSAKHYAAKAAASAALVLPQQKLDATAAPTSSDDVNDGYGIGSIWVDITHDRSYVCLDATVANAAWKSISFDNINVKDYGAVGDGVTDDSAAFTAAIAAANTIVTGSGSSALATATLFIPPGNYSIETGTTIAGCNLSIKSLGKQTVRLTLGTGVVFLTSTGTVTRFTCIDSVTTVGGAGFFNHTSTNANVQGICEVSGNEFYDYTGTAVGTLSSDFPYWTVERNLFQGTTSLTSFGFVHMGRATGLSLRANAFTRNKYHAKIAMNGNNQLIEQNDFIRFTNGGGSPALTDIWLIPKSTQTDAGRNTRISHNKFGNENANAADYRILVADEGSGTNGFDKSHATTESSGYVTNVIVKDNIIYGDTQSMIYSYTYQIRHWQIHVDNYDRTGNDNYILEYDAAVTWPVEFRTIDNNFIYVGNRYDVTEGEAPLVSNELGNMLIASDPLNIMQGKLGAIQQYPSGGAVGFTNLLDNTDATAFSTGSASLSGITDALGGSNAATATFSSSGGAVFEGIDESLVIPGMVAWYEIDIKQSSTLPMTTIALQIQRSSNSTPAFRRVITVPSDWTTIRFPWIPKQNGESISFYIHPIGYDSGVATKIDIGRPRLYHCSEPVHPLLNYLEVTTTYDPGSLADGAGETSGDITVTGAELGDFVEVAAPYDLQGILATAYVSAADTVKIRLQNETGGTIDLASGVWKVRVKK